MDAIENAGLPESTSTEAVEVSSPSSEVSSTPSTSESGASAPEQEWKPNYKVKSYDKEYEIPENFRSYINKENEKNFREVFEKAYGLDEMKSKNQKIRETNQQYEKQIKEQYAPVLENWSKLQRFVKAKDYDSLFENAGLPEQELQAWMLKKLQLRDLPPDQQELYNQNRAAQQKLYQLEQENNQYKSQVGQYTEYQRSQQLQQRNQEFDSYLNQPGVVEAAKTFDSRLGQDGAFKIEVLRRAVVLAQVTGKDPTIEECVKDAMRVIGWQGEQAPTNNAGSPQADPKPTLPNISGKPSSPVAQKVKSLADLKKLKAQSIKNMSR